MYTLTNNNEYTLNKLIFKRQPRTNSHALFHIWKLDMLMHKLAHMYAKFHITLTVWKYVAKPNKKIHIDTRFIQVAHKIFSNWSNNPYYLTQRHFFVACSYKAPCNHVHWNWDTLNTHTPTILRHSWRCRKFIHHQSICCPQSSWRYCNLSFN